MLSRRTGPALAALLVVAASLVAVPAQAACPSGTVATQQSSGSFGVIATCRSVTVTPPRKASRVAPLPPVAYCISTPTGIQPVYAGKEAQISGASDAALRVPCPSARPAGPTSGQIRIAAAQAVASITLPPVDPLYGPHADLNPWHLVAVGYPLWLWTPDRGPIVTSVSSNGITIAITAVRSRTRFAMGDGATVACARTTPWTVAVPPGTPSPTCGYAYPAMNRVEGRGFTLVAVDDWDITWSALGLTGTAAMTQQASLPMPVGELQSLVTTRTQGQ